MADYYLEGDYSSKMGSVKVGLLLVSFQDENKIHFIYSPHLDLTGYGHNQEEAKESFKIALEDFVDYTLKKKTLGKVLRSLGWSMKGSVKSPKKIKAPSITKVIGTNTYVSEIFDKYPVQTYHEDIGLPAFA